MFKLPLRFQNLLVGTWLALLLVAIFASAESLAMKQNLQGRILKAGEEKTSAQQFFSASILNEGMMTHSPLADEFKSLPVVLQNEIRKLLEEEQELLQLRTSLAELHQSILSCETSCPCGAYPCQQDTSPIIGRAHDQCIMRCDRRIPQLESMMSRYETSKTQLQRKANALNKKIELQLAKKKRQLRPVEGATRK